MVIVSVFQIVAYAFSHAETWLMDHTAISVSLAITVVRSMELHVSVCNIFFLRSMSFVTVTNEKKTFEWYLYILIIACSCNNQGTQCTSETGKCFCTTKGIIGDHCERCDVSGLYHGDPTNKGSCFCELTDGSFILYFSSFIIIKISHCLRFRWLSYRLPVYI